MTFIRTRRHYYNRERPIWEALLYRKTKLLPGHLRHFNVRYQETRQLVANFLKGIKPVAGGYYLVSCTLHAECQKTED